jgi:hypothetical protein
MRLTPAQQRARIAEYRTLALEVLRPERVQRDDAVALVRGMTDPALTWETLAAHGLIPFAWLDAPDRAFRRDDGTTTRRPPSADACLTLASDVAGVVAVEALAHELVLRLAPLGVGAVPARVVWYCVPSDEWRPEPDPFAALIVRLRRLVPDEYPDEVAAVIDRGMPYRALGRLAAVARGAELWRCAAAANLRLDGVPVAEIPDPFAPLLAIWSRGYAVDSLDHHDVQLVASRLVT